MWVQLGVSARDVTQWCGAGNSEAPGRGCSSLSSFVTRGTDSIFNKWCCELDESRPSLKDFESVESKYLLLCAFWICVATLFVLNNAGTAFTGNF